MPLPQSPSLLDSIKESLDNRIYLVLAIAGVLTMITGFIKEPGYMGWVQGFSIYIGVLLMIIFTSLNDFFKDKSFLKLA